MWIVEGDTYLSAPVYPPRSSTLSAPSPWPHHLNQTKVCQMKKGFLPYEGERKWNLSEFCRCFWPCHMAKGLLPNQGSETCESESFFKVSLSCWLSFALGSVRWESEFFFSFGIIIWIKFCYQKGFHWNKSESESFALFVGPTIWTKVKVICTIFVGQIMWTKDLCQMSGNK